MVGGSLLAIILSAFYGETHEDRSFLCDFFHYIKV